MAPLTAPGPWKVQPPTLLERIIFLGTPYLDAETANKEVIRLVVENIRLQARLDELKEARSCGNS